jgi:hypothetical protein
MQRSIAAAILLYSPSSSSVTASIAFTIRQDGGSVILGTAMIKQHTR